MTPLEEFQAKHGEAFSSILNNPAFSAGMIFLSIQLTQRIKMLEDHEITQNSVTLLADFRGRLRHESDLISLAVPPEPVGKNDLMENYPNSVEEQFEEHQRNNPPPIV